MHYLHGFDVEDGHTSMTCPAHCRKHTHVEGFTRANSQSYIRTGYDACTKGMHKNVLPTNAAFWWGGAVNCIIANKCKGLVSANACLLDPTNVVSATQTLNNDNITVMTSNCLPRTASPIHYPCKSFTTAARALSSTPTQDSLNAITIATTQAIIDKGATSIFIMDGVVPGQSALPTLLGLKRLRKKRMVWVLTVEKLWDLEV